MTKIKKGIVFYDLKGDLGRSQEIGVYKQYAVSLTLNYFLRWLWLVLIMQYECSNAACTNKQRPDFTCQKKKKKKKAQQAKFTE